MAHFIDHGVHRNRLADGKAAFELIRRSKPDAVVFDLRTPVLCGIEIARELAQHSPRVVICSWETSADVVEAALEAGASGYVFKQRLGKDLILAVKTAIQGKRFVSPGSR